MDSKPSTSSGEWELLRVSRVEDELAIFVQGKHIHRLQEIKDPQVGRETIQAIKAVLSFSKDWLPSIQQEQAALSPPSEADALPTKPIKQSRTSPPLSSKTLPSSLTSSMRQTSSRFLDPLPLVREINNLVQKNPELTNHDVHLTIGPGGGLRIYVGQQAFDKVDNIPDPEIKALIQKAIQEWEGR